MTQASYSGSRRLFMKQAAGLGGLAAVGFGGLFSSSEAFAQASGDSPQTMANLAATMETFVVTHLTNLLTRRTFSLTPAEVLQARLLLASEQAHLNVATNLGGRAATTQFFFPPALYTDRNFFGVTTADLETVCTAAYLAASRRFAELGESRLAAAHGQIACSEAQHISVARALIGAVPSDIAWAVPAFYNVSDAQPMLAPFLSPSAEYNFGAQYPGAEAVDGLIGEDARRLLVEPPLFPSAF